MGRRSALSSELENKIYGVCAHACPALLWVVQQRGGRGMKRFLTSAFFFLERLLGRRFKPCSFDDTARTIALVQISGSKSII